MPARALLLLALVAPAGCGGPPAPEYAPVEGKVTRDGRPLAGVLVTFEPEPSPGANRARTAEGVTDEAGAYRLRTEDAGGERDGAAVGAYRVVLRDPAARPGDPRARASAVIPVEYTVPARTPLKDVAVPAGGRTYDIAVAPQPKAGKAPK